MSTDSGFFLRTPLGMNLRNELIRQGSSFMALRRVKDKAGFKRIMRENGILTARTYNEIHDFSDMPLLKTFPDEFVVKPNRGSGGKGIILLERRGDRFVDPSGQRYSPRDLQRHIRRILDGDFSGYVAQDIAIIEERLYPSARLQFKEAYGLPDLRIFCFRSEPVMAMLRYPTFKSRGRANLAAGGIGIGVDVSTGRPTYIHTKGTVEFEARDIGIPADFVMPKWTELKGTAVLCSRIAGLPVTGVDLVLDASDRVMVLEVNGRPGIEIQNINEDSLRPRLLGRPEPA